MRNYLREIRYTAPFEIETTYRLPSGPVSMSVPTPKFVPKSRLSLSVMSCFALLSATRSSRRGSSTPIFRRFPVRLNRKRYPPAVSGVAAPANRSFWYCGPSARLPRKPIAAGGVANFQLNSGSL